MGCISDKSNLGTVDAKVYHDVEEAFNLNMRSDSFRSTLKEARTLSPKPTNDEDAYPCTSLQEGLMALLTRQPGNFMPQSICKLPPTFDVERFKAAWQKTVDANMTLRTNMYQTSALELIQVVFESHQIDWQGGDCLDDYLKLDRCNAVGFGSFFSTRGHR